MKTNLAVTLLVLAVLSSACQGATPPSPPTPTGQVETSVAATIAAGQTVTAVIEQAVRLTLTAAVPSPTNTLLPSPTPVPEPTTAVPPTDTPEPTATKKPTIRPTAVPPTAGLTTGTFSFNVPANFGWVNTGLKITAGQTVAIAASGIVNTWGGTEMSNSDANGQPPSICDHPQCAMLNMNYGTLVGRLDNGPRFRIGVSSEFVASTTGQLYLAVNDWEYSDNIGSYSITVAIR